MAALVAGCWDSTEPPPTSTSLDAASVTDAFTRNWSDDGKAAAAVFAFDEGEARVDDPYDANDVETAQRSGATMWSVGQWLSPQEQWQKFEDVGDGETAGARNPEAARTLAVSLSPYLGAMVGDYRTDVLPGFPPEPLPGSTWPDPDRDNSFSGAVRMFALANTDEIAGKRLIRDAQELALQYAEKYASDPHAPGAARNLTWAGALTGVIDRGTSLGMSDSIGDNTQKSACQRKAEALTQPGDRAQGVRGNLAQDADTFGVSLECIGSRFPLLAFTQAHYYILSRMNISPEIQAQYSELFEDGKLRPWKDLSGSGDSTSPNLTPDLNELLGRVGDSQSLIDGYNAVMR
ncbi:MULTISPECIES: hypothetical protein [unclassified Nocardia]|uniref:hypothetical protein n=1 Tax=Nocardia sp. AG03 TaxID=3025312 RepID=UPI0024184CF7|nr:hypothetical protein [Nocardia sp. AG03]